MASSITGAWVGSQGPVVRPRSAVVASVFAGPTAAVVTAVPALSGGVRGPLLADSGSTRRGINRTDVVRPCGAGAGGGGGV